MTKYIRCIEKNKTNPSCPQILAKIREIECSDIF